MTDPRATLTFDRDRVRQLLEAIERLAAGDPQMRLEFSAGHDELDAIAFGVNVLVDELRWAHARIRETEREQTEARHEQALRRSDAKFETAFHSNPCAMTLVRLSDGRFQDVNASFERQTGFPRDEVIGRTVREIGLWIDPDDLVHVRAEMRAGGRLGSREVRFRTKRGDLATAVYSADTILFGCDACVLAVGLDVTDRKNSELQAAALREELAHRGRVTMIEALTGSLAHEINQPLTAVAANADAAVRLLAAQPPRLADLGDALREILSDNRRAGDVMRRMRTLLKKGTTDYETVDVNSSITEVIKLVRGNAVGRRISLEADLASGIEPVRADRIQLQQVVLNLLLNAFDAVQECEPSGRRVWLRTARRDRAAVIEVSDHGTGLSDDALARIFEPFFTTKRDGMGLGLSICRAIVVAHGGTLEATRQNGTGMRFSATFPVLTALASPGSRPSAVDRMPAS